MARMPRMLPGLGSPVGSGPTIGPLPAPALPAAGMAVRRPAPPPSSAMAATRDSGNVRVAAAKSSYKAGRAADLNKAQARLGCSPTAGKGKGR